MSEAARTSRLYDAIRLERVRENAREAAADAEDARSHGDADEARELLAEVAYWREVEDRVVQQLRTKI